MKRTGEKEERKQSSTDKTEHSLAKRQGSTASSHQREDENTNVRSRNQPVIQLQRSHGNQAVQRLLSSSTNQAKQGVNNSGDRYEQEANRTAEQVTPVSKPAVHRTCACGNHTTAGGECEECSEKKQSGLQTKLEVNKQGDIYEKEADRVADQVMAATADRTISGTPSGLQRFPRHSNEQADTAPASVDQALASAGRPLEPVLRQDMEQLFGHNFSDVRVHVGATAAKSTRDVNAHAYTVGHDIVFGADRFGPEAHGGRWLLAHELTHVVQQSDMSQNCVQRGPLNRGPPKTDIPVFGGSSSTSDYVILYHYGNLEAMREQDTNTKAGAPFKSPPGFPRLTNYGTASTQGDVAKHTGTPVTDNIRFKYELRIDRAYFEKHFPNVGDRGAYSEFTHKEPIPLKYFRKVSEVGPTSSAPSRLSPRSGELPARPPPRTPPTSAGGGPPLGGVSSTSTSTGIKAQTGTPLKPVIETTPGFRPAKGASFGGAFLMLQAMQVGSLQQAEVEKFQKRFAELQPKIDAYHESGYSVELIMIVEKPKSPDILCKAGIFCGQDQLT